MTEVISVGISFPKEVLAKIDSMRRDVPRSRYLLRLIESAVQSGEKHVYKECNISDKLADNQDQLDSSCEPAIKRSRST